MSSAELGGKGQAIVPYSEAGKLQRENTSSADVVTWLRLFVQDDWDNPAVKPFAFNNEYPIDHLIAVFSQHAQPINKERLRHITDILFEDQIPLLAGESSIPRSDTHARQQEITTLGNILLLSSSFGASEKTRSKMFELYQKEAIEGAAMHRISPGTQPRYGMTIQEQFLEVLALHGSIPGLDDEESVLFYRKQMTDTENPHFGFTGLLRTSSSSAFEALSEYLPLVEKSGIHPAAILWGVTLYIEETGKENDLADFLRKNPDIAQRYLTPLTEIDCLEDFPNVFASLHTAGLV